MLRESEPTVEKEYLCLAVAIRNNEVCHYIVLKRWQNTDNKFSNRGFLGGENNTIIAWCETPELPKNIPLADVLSSYYNDCSINAIIQHLENFNEQGDNTYAIKLIKNRFMNNTEKGE
jgi:hypothetical protein